MDTVEMPCMIFVVSPNGYKFCKLKIVDGAIILAFKKMKSGKEPFHREVEIELMEWISIVLQAAMEYCRRTGQQIHTHYQKLTYRA